MQKIFSRGIAWAAGAAVVLSPMAAHAQVLNGGFESPVIVPQFHTPYLLAPISLALDATETQPKAAFFGQSRTRDWTFTPEVCLGPAFRSLAPPFLG